MENSSSSIFANLRRLINKIDEKSENVYWSRVILFILIIGTIVVSVASAGSCLKNSNNNISNSVQTPHTQQLVINANTVGNSAFNLKSARWYEASFAHQDKWLYYSFEGHGIHRISDNGDENDIEKLSSDNGYYLNVIGEWLYYITEDSTSHSTSQEYVIKRVKIDGSKEERLIENILTIEAPLFVGNGYIFFTNITSNGKPIVYKTDLEGQYQTIIGSGYLETVNFVSEVLLTYEARENYDDYYVFNAYTFDGNVSYAYNTVIESFNYDADFGYIHVYDIPDSLDYIVCAGNYYDYARNYFLVGIVSGTTGDARELTLYDNNSFGYDNTIYYDNILYYAGSPIEDSSNSELGTEGIYSIENHVRESLLNDAPDIYSLFIPGDGWIYYKRLYGNDSAWFRCTLDGQNEEYVSWMYS